MEEVYSVGNPVQVMVILEDNPGAYPYVEWMGNHILYRDSMYSLALLNAEIKRHSMVIARSPEFDELILYVEDLEGKENGSMIKENDSMHLKTQSEDSQNMENHGDSDFIHLNKENK